MADRPFDELLRSVSLASIAAEKQREMLQRTIKDAVDAGASLRKVAEASGFSHAGIRKMISDRDREAIASIQKRLDDSMKPLIENMARLDVPMRKMIADASRQMKDMTAKGQIELTRQIAEAVKAARVDRTR